MRGRGAGRAPHAAPPSLTRPPTWLLAFTAPHGPRAASSYIAQYSDTVNGCTRSVEAQMRA